MENGLPDVTSPSKRSQPDGLQTWAMALEVPEKTGEMQHSRIEKKKTSCDCHTILKTQVPALKTTEISEGRTLAPSGGRG